MAVIQIPRKYANQEIRIPIQTRSKERIIVRASHPNKPNTVYFNAAPFITGKDCFIVKIPNMPESVMLEVYSEKNGNAKHDPLFRVGPAIFGPITQSFAVTRIMDSNVEKFAKFIDNFAENAAVLSAQNSIYRSPDGKFQIDYVDTIRDDQGRALRTPLRVNSATKVIQIAKNQFIHYTVPGRKMWLWHEFSHVWKNIRPEDELEADKNAIMIYLGYGNPIVEAYNVILSVFKNTPSNLNRQRYEALNTYIKNFNKTIKQC